ncbi:uncharacterized protein A1O9_02342 [Exophiala aquamarina CBS 119918]|uniref:Uncharacterized protein n=1 Tax=Exophiala aquamarina CBS 119918 TaxID=1182545 RepID=A0A072PYW4_9EURO|nr:uncharacterized protein A1O9_02342 [Exophiala aquamarina CBS 119918]KEF60780.1 hypothetical protein A1O9_02342 [Exophiala aquamarina CBS 119918]
MTELSELDLQNCQGIYNIDSDCTILGFGSGTGTHPQLLHEPKCTCGAPCPSVHRYSDVAKLLNFSRTLDLLLAKLGRKLKNFAKSTDFFQKSLSNSRENFMSEIRPNPLAATANTQLLLRRHRDVINLHRQIGRFRDEVVVPVEQSLQDLHNAIPQFVPRYVTLFRSRFDILEYRAMVVRIADDLKLANHLLKLADPSRSVQRQGLKMLQFVCKQSLACMVYCQDALSNDVAASAPPVAAELRLQNAQFFILAKASGLKLSSLGYGDTCPPSPIPTEAVHNSLLKIMEEVGPAFHGRNAFVSTAKAFQDYISSSDTNETTILPMITNDSSRQIEKSWGNHELGALTTCVHSHIYSKRSFPAGCADCGLSRPPTPRISEKFNTFREAEFLKTIHALSARTYGSTPNRLEEKFEANAVDEALSLGACQSPKPDKSNLVRSPVSEHVMEVKQEAVDQVLSNLGDRDRKDLENSEQKEFITRDQKDLENRKKFLAALHKMGI